LRPQVPGITLFDKYIERPQALARHQSAPLVRERARFLAHTESRGTGKQTIRIAAAYLLRIIELLGLSKLRNVTIEEVDQAASRWNELRNQENHYTGGKAGVRCFRLTAQRFLRFLGKLKCLPVRQPFSKYLNDFVHAMEREYGFAEATIRGRRYRAANFLTWYARRHRTLRDIRLTDVDAYITRKPLEGWNPVTRRSEASSLRTFLYHAESRGWCRHGIASGIQAPSLRRELFEPMGPAWRDVQRLLKATRGTQPNELRAKALLLLFAVYGLRRSEAANLLLTDIDWAANRFTVRRAKRGGFQQFPLCEELSTAIRSYIENARPRCSLPNVFISLKPPFEPLRAYAISDVVRSRMRKLGISSKHTGPQCLRHACATRLLHNGSSFMEIADFLGHRDTQNVNVYARVSPGMLREVASMDLTRAL
jgi:integrase/recombinase XerD